MNPKYKSAKTITSSSDRQSTRPERHKYLFELMKHMTSLSSGSVVLLVTFLEKILHEKTPHQLITIAFGGFCISIIFSVSTMLMVASNFGEEFPEKDKNYFTAFGAIAIVGFFTGMFFLMNAAYHSY